MRAAIEQTGLREAQPCKAWVIETKRLALRKRLGEAGAHSKYLTIAGGFSPESRISDSGSAQAVFSVVSSCHSPELTSKFQTPVWWTAMQLLQFMQENVSCNTTIRCGKNLGIST